VTRDARFPYTTLFRSRTGEPARPVTRSRADGPRAGCPHGCLALGDRVLGESLRPRLRWPGRRARDLLLDRVLLLRHRRGREPRTGAGAATRRLRQPLKATRARARPGRAGTA